MLVKYQCFGIHSVYVTFQLLIRIATYLSSVTSMVQVVMLSCTIKCWESLEFSMKIRAGSNANVLSFSSSALCANGEYCDIATMCSISCNYNIFDIEVSFCIIYIRHPASTSTYFKNILTVAGRFTCVCSCTTFVSRNLGTLMSMDNKMTGNV